MQLVAVEMNSHFFISAFISFDLRILAPHVGNEPHPKLPFNFGPFIDQTVISLRPFLKNIVESFDLFCFPMIHCF